MPVDDGFVTAVSPSGQKRRVPRHYLTNKRLGFKLPPSTRGSQRQAPPEPDPTSTTTSGHQADTTTKETT